LDQLGNNRDAVLKSVGKAFGIGDEVEVNLEKINKQVWNSCFGEESELEVNHRPTQAGIRKYLKEEEIELNKKRKKIYEFNTYDDIEIQVFDAANRLARDIHLYRRAVSAKVAIKNEWDSPHSLTWLIRAASSIIVAGFPIQTISRLRRVDTRFLKIEESDHALDIYGAWIRSLLNATLALQRNRDQFTPHNTPKLREPLYRSEIIWLLNERAIVSHVQGRMDDSLATFKLAIAASQEVPWGAEAGPHRSEAMSSLWGVRLNQAIARMEAGKLRQARRRLDILLDLRQRDEELGRRKSLVLELANGWAGVNDYYRGNLKRAESRLDEAVKYLQSVQDNLRGLSIFRRFQAHTWFRMGKIDDALAQIELSIEAANAGDHRDLVYLSAVAKAKMLVDMDNEQSLEREDEAVALIERAEDYADRMGMPRLEMLSKI
ncbi:MAG: hypothetical protein RIC82_00120, partial [Parvibaculum sp.]